MRTMLTLALLALSYLASAAAQVTPSENMGCTVVGNGMACNGIEIVGEKEKDSKMPRLFVTHFLLEPDAVLEQPSPSSDYLIIGINGGDLLNEKTPLLHV